MGKRNEQKTTKSKTAKPRSTMKQDIRIIFIQKKLPYSQMKHIKWKHQQTTQDKTKQSKKRKEKTNNRNGVDGHVCSHPRTHTNTFLHWYVAIDDDCF